MTQPLRIQDPQGAESQTRHSETAECKNFSSLSKPEVYLVRSLPRAGDPRTSTNSGHLVSWVEGSAQQLSPFHPPVGIAQVHACDRLCLLCSSASACPFLPQARLPFPPRWRFCCGSEKAPSPSAGQRLRAGWHLGRDFGLWSNLTLRYFTS